MNKDILQGNWKIVQSKLKEKWAKLTDNDLKEIEADYDLLVGHLIKNDGLEKDQAKAEVESFWENEKQALLQQQKSA